MCVAGSDLGSQCVNTGSSTISGDTVGLLMGSGATASMLNTAIGMWDDCPGYDTAFASFLMGSPGDRTYTVHYNSGISKTTCGYTVGDDIYLWGYVFVNGVKYPCRNTGVTLAHELGHTLGLGESTCDGYIMSPRNPASTTDYRTVQSGECKGAADKWITTDERTGGGNGDCIEESCLK